jgi:hypothetical protein
MTATSSSQQTGRTRRLFVTVVIATAAAAVTAGVAFKERHSGEAVVSWKRPAPLSESAPTSIHEPVDASATLADPSLPAAADALKGVSGATGEPAPTF